jgi:hypothetical protein
MNRNMEYEGSQKKKAEKAQKRKCLKLEIWQWVIRTLFT